MRNIAPAAFFSILTPIKEKTIFTVLIEKVNAS
jgi:hypothetical protein